MARLVSTALMMTLRPGSVSTMSDAPRAASVSRPPPRSQCPSSSARAPADVLPFLQPPNDLVLVLREHAHEPVRLLDQLVHGGGGMDKTNGKIPERSSRSMEFLPLPWSAAAKILCPSMKSNGTTDRTAAKEGRGKEENVATFAPRRIRVSLPCVKLRGRGGFSQLIKY